jgi:hypothetical protein
MLKLEAFDEPGAVFKVNAFRGSSQCSSGSLRIKGVESKSKEKG